MYALFQEHLTISARDEEITVREKRMARVLFWGNTTLMDYIRIFTVHLLCRLAEIRMENSMKVPVV